MMIDEYLRGWNAACQVISEDLISFGSHDDSTSSYGKEFNAGVLSAGKAVLNYKNKIR